MSFPAIYTVNGIVEVDTAMYRPNSPLMGDIFFHWFVVGDNTDTLASLVSGGIAISVCRVAACLCLVFVEGGEGEEDGDGVCFG